MVAFRVGSFQSKSLSPDFVMLLLLSCMFAEAHERLFKSNAWLWLYLYIDGSSRNALFKLHVRSGVEFLES